MHQKNKFGQALGNPVENWIAHDKPGTALIKGNYCILEPIDIQKHSIKLFDVLTLDNQGESWTYLPYGPFTTYSDFDTWVRETIAENDTLLYAILDIKTKEPVGIAGYLRINPTHGVIEIGHLHFSKLLKKRL